VPIVIVQVLLLDRITDRVKINGVGLKDVVQYDVGTRGLEELQVFVDRHRHLFFLAGPV
jgi:hypothetical protein